MRKWAVIVVIIAAVAGGVLSGIAAGHYFSFLRGGLDQPSFCNLGERLNCDVVTASSYATITGLPVAGLGLLYFLVQGLFGAWIAFAPIGADRRSTAGIGALIGSLALIYPAYLAAIMAAKLHTWCLTCLGIDLAALLVAIGWWVALRCAVNERWRLVRRRIGPHAALFLVVMGIGAIFLASATQAAQTVGKRPRLTKGEISRAVALFQRGSPFDLASLPEGRPFWGNPNAKATVIEFSDFQCPFCKEAVPVWPPARPPVRIPMGDSGNTMMPCLGISKNYQPRSCRPWPNRSVSTNNASHNASATHPRMLPSRPMWLWGNTSI
ncbi:MAG: thioredoxin domain-containing protein [Deltaproteobacteria bacterium]|nr:thioredoxin domain-containing protein [Deltaproteobacteria bacterium]